MAFYLQLTIIWLITWAAQHVPGFVGSQNSILQNPGVLLLRCHVNLFLQSSPGKNNYSPNRALVSFSRVQTGANIDRQHHCQKNAIGYTVLNQKKRIILSWFTRTSNVSYFTCCSCHKTSRDCQASKTKKTIKCIKQYHQSSPFNLCTICHVFSSHMMSFVWWTNQNIGMLPIDSYHKIDCSFSFHLICFFKHWNSNPSMPLCSFMKWTFACMMIRFTVLACRLEVNTSCLVFYSKI